MKFIKRLSHDARVLEDAILGWDIFRCRDYSNIDGAMENLSDVRKVKPIFGYTIIFAVNIKGLKLFGRLFIRTTL
jgi:hypothetical protein